MTGSSQSDPTNRLPDSPQPLELCSGFVDGELSELELSAFNVLLSGDGGGGDARIRQFEQECRWVGNALRAIPASKPGSQIIEAVRELSAAELVPTANIAKRAHWPQRLSTAKTLAVTTLAAVAMLLVVASQRNFNGPQRSESLVADASRNSAAPDSAARIETGAVGNSVFAVPGPVVKTDDQAATVESTELAATVLSQGEDWQILVVRVSAANRDAVMKQIEDVAVSTGLRMESVDHSVSVLTDVDPASRMGIMLTSGRPEANAFVDSVTHSAIIQSSEWNPAEIAKMDRRSLIAAIRESMKTPSKSELHFGEVFLALPRQREIHVARNDVPRSDSTANDPVGDGSPGSAANPASDALPRSNPESVIGALRTPAAALPAELASSEQVRQNRESESGLPAPTKANGVDRLQNRPIFVVFEFDSLTATDLPCL